MVDLSLKVIYSFLSFETHKTIFLKNRKRNIIEVATTSHEKHIMLQLNHSRHKLTLFVIVFSRQHGNTCKDLFYNDFTYNINRCDMTYMFLFTVISKVIYK